MPEIAALPSDYDLPPETNYFTEAPQSYVRIVMALFKDLAMLQMQRSENSQQKMKNLVHRYEKATEQTAASQRSVGNAALWTAAISATCVCLSLFNIAYLSKSDQKIFGTAAQDWVPKFGEMYNSRNYANQSLSQGRAQVVYQEMQNEYAKQQDATTQSGNNASVLNAAFQLQQAASRAG